jgi:transposase
VTGGMSKRKAAKALGVDPKTIRNDVGKKSPENGDKFPIVKPDREPKLSEFKRADGQIKAACDYNPEDPGSIGPLELKDRFHRPV